MHPSSESFSFGTLKDIVFLFFCFNLSFTTTQSKTKEQENEIKKETKAVWKSKVMEEIKLNEKAR